MAPEPAAVPPPAASAAKASAPVVPAPAAGPAAVMPMLFVATLGLLLASFPARNADVWEHLASGRVHVHGAAARISPTWLYDVIVYGLFLAFGGAGLVAAKAAVVAALAVVLVRLSRAAAGGWLIPVACTVLALLAVASRVPLAPVTVSYLLLAVAARAAWQSDSAGSVWPGEWLAGLFLVWGNLDRWFVLGLAVVALIQVGRWLDERPTVGGLLRRLGMVGVLAVAAVANPAHLEGFPLPAELGWGTADPAIRPAVTSPFAAAYLSAQGSSPTALAYYPLLGLSLVSFPLARPRRWGRFLPWAGLAALSAVQARAVPFFAVVAGPVLAWNLHDFFARRPIRGWSPRPAMRAIGRALVGVLAVAFLVSAWPGWLQRPPYEPRRWAVEPPAGLERAAVAVCISHADRGWQGGSRTLHLARDTEAAFAWFCPEDEGVFDPDLAAAVADTAGDGAEERLAAARVARVVVRAGDRGTSLAVLTRLLADPDGWPLRHLQGGVAVFGRHPTAAGDPLPGRKVDFDRLAFRPTEAETAPPAPAARRWWDAFRRPAPPPAGDRDQAAVLLLKAEVMRTTAPQRHLAAWESDQAAALAAAAGGWIGPAGAADAALRLTVFRPPVPPPSEALPPITRSVFDCQRLFVLARDDAPPGILYAAVRAARRAVSADPADAGAHLLLGQCYLRLLSGTRERVWALRLPQLAQLRQAQASTALNRAVVLNPKLAQAHLELGRLYQQTGALDLALTHLRAYRDAAGRAGRDGVPDAELADLAAAVDRALAAFAPESGRARVADRARAALERGLAGDARALLLESDVSAFGAEGTQLELNLLLRTGRAADVRDWTAAEFKGSLGAAGYHWVRAQALAALGDYAAADAELAELAAEEGPLPNRAIELAAMLAGRAVLNEQPAGHDGLPAAITRALARFDFQAAVQQLTARLAGQADAAVFRGLLALESGAVGRAREAFQTALTYSADAPAGGGLDFKGRPVARDALGLLRSSDHNSP